ncbi:MAG: hypothetical protein OHK93_008644 [Ramalina farinacea]|uniref:Micro-fibrillar-associated protein 1 C-terminal domain-containing protein n=1 Tax=Ramalina farinacea TaxID=258253 RepID=A0AA43QMU8_9LECA|nr:hypothetical protein [Ramalina farinacea]
MASKRMTANPVKPARYRPGKPVAEDPSSDEEDESDEEQEIVTQPPPKATSFPSDARKVAANLGKVDLHNAKTQALRGEEAKNQAERVARAIADEGFVTEESEEERNSESESESDGSEESEEEESSSEDEPAPKLLRPTFIKKDQRKEGVHVAEVKDEDDRWAEEEARRKEKADSMIQEQLEKDAAARAAGKKDWDDDEVQEVEQVDDTDGLDPETERAAWKLRELRRVKREREAIELAEKEREEIERRRNLSAEERDAEDKEFLEAQKEEREGRGKMSYMQKYFHKGAFFQDDAAAEGLANRDLMGSRIADDVTNRELLPQYMQIRDMTKLGRKGRTKYKDLKSEDTGRWGEEAGRGPKRDGVDERFMPDRKGGGERSGANAAPIGERRKAPDGAPTGPSAHRPGGGDRYQPQVEDGRPSRRERSYSRTPSPSRRRRRSYSRTPPRRRDRRRSPSYSRSPSPRRERYRNDAPRRKRSRSHHDHHSSDKRQRVEAY